MKFCSNCGAQCVDEAIICITCGTSFNEPVNQPAAGSKPLKVNANANENKNVIADFVFKLTLILYAASSFLSIIYAGCWTSFSSKYVYFYLDEVFLVISTIIAVPVFVSGIISFLSGISQKDNLNVKLSGALRLITSVLVALVTVLALAEHL
ncbi:MAG: hypothetical protein J6R20_03740 [Clostridia bacterium]|nr:hypothetical protein [Clostridia bacterium]